MTAMRWRALAALLLMIVAFGAAQAWRPTAKLADSRPRVELEVIFPKQFGEWAIDDRMPVQLVSPDTQAVLDKIYSQTLSRTYVNRRGDRVMLSVAYGGDQSDATRAHRPEVCYPAQGFQINAGVDGVVQTSSHPVRVRQLVAKAGARNEPISYWIVVGDRVTLSGTEQKLAQLSYSTRGVVADGMLVRVSTIDGDVRNAYRVHERFIAELSAAVPDRYRSQVIGASGRLAS
ncbi:MAG: exosortase-associated protein EpsI, B-type [Rubrivivax sp.]